MEKPREEGCCLDATPAWKHTTCVDGGVEKLNVEDFRKCLSVQRAAVLSWIWWSNTLITSSRIRSFLESTHVKLFSMWDVNWWLWESTKSASLKKSKICSTIHPIRSFWFCRHAVPGGVTLALSRSIDNFRNVIQFWISSEAFMDGFVPDCCDEALWVWCYSDFTSRFSKSTIPFGFWF